MALIFTDAVWEEGSENMGGLIGDVYYMPASAADISGLTCTDGITLTGNIVPVGSQEAVKIYATEASIELLDAQQGEIDGESTLNTLNFFFPGSKKALAAFKRKVTVVPGIWFARDSDNNWRVLGLTAIQVPTAIGTYTVSKDISARVTAKEGTHGNRGDTRKGTLITVTYTAVHEALFYDGVLPYDLPEPE